MFSKKMTDSCSDPAHHLDQHTDPRTTPQHDHRQPSAMPGGTSVTVRLRVTVPTYTELPDRVRLVVKERGALFFPYRRKLATLHFDSWTRLPDNVWHGCLVQKVSMDVPKLLTKAQSKLLSLKLYCLHRRTVQYKAVGSLERLLQQGRYEELMFDLYYPGCPLQVHYPGCPFQVHYPGCPLQVHYPGCPLQVQATTTQAAHTNARRSSDSHEEAEEPQEANHVALDYHDDVGSDGSALDHHSDAVNGGSDLDHYSDASSGGSDLDHYSDAPNGEPEVYHFEFIDVRSMAVDLNHYFQLFEYHYGVPRCFRVQ